MSSFRGRTKSPSDLLEKVGMGPEEYLRLELWLKWDFFHLRNGVTLRSTSMEAEDLKGDEADMLQKVRDIPGKTREL